MIFRSSTRARVAPSGRRSPSSWPSRMSGRRPRRSSLCPRPLSAVRTSVQPTGRADVRCPGDRCPRDRCDPGVRTDRRPVSAASASKLSALRWIRNTSVRRGRPRLAHQVRRIAVVGERLARRRPNRAWRGREVQRWQCVARTSVEGRAGPPLTQPPGMRTGSGVELAAWRPRELTRRQSAGGARKEQVLTKLPAGASWAGCRRDADHRAGPGGGDHAAWSLSWCWSGVVRLWRAHPVQLGADCGRSAAAVCEERCPLGADSALTCENCGGRDRV
jgi:hypothetical protein